MKLSELNAILREIRVSPVRSLGQNFLHDQNVAKAIVAAADLNASDFVVEVGPGLGALTEFIVAKGARLLAIEKDPRLAQFLRERFADNQRVDIQCMDALVFDVRQLFGEPTVKLVANLPYSVASQILIRFLEFPSPISFALLMLQKEMAERLAASPSTPQYGALSVRLQHDYKIELVRTVRPTVFVPQPEVDSAVIRVTPRPAEAERAIDRELFGKLVRAGFSQRRKQLRKLLDVPEADWRRVSEATGLSSTARAEDLSLAQWINLTNTLTGNPPESAGGRPEELFSVVDENDQQVRLAPRSEVHANNLRHRAVHMLIFDPAGRVLLQKRSRFKDRHPLQWDSSAAGHVDAGEGYDEAAKRELWEELGIDVALREFGRLGPSEATGQEFIRVYRGVHDGAFHIDRHEIEWAGHFEPDLVVRWLAARPEEFAPGFRECWRLYCGGG